MNKKIPKYLKLTFAASILGTSLLTGFPTNAYAEGTLTVLDVNATQNGWSLQDGTWYYYKDGILLMNTWITSGGQYYYLGEDGSMQTNTWIGNYYVDSNGVWLTNYQPAHWVPSGSRWWYRNEDGSYPTGTWKTINGTQYYFDNSGYMASGWQIINGKWYYFNGSGIMQSNTWIVSSGKYYYMGEDGTMLTNTWIGDHYVDSNGVWLTNYQPAKWMQTNGKWWYRNEDGSYPANTWKKINNNWYYFDSAGYLITNDWKKVGGSWYYFDGNGIMLTGNQTIDNKKYYFNEDGSMHTGWLDTWYYYDESGAMVTGWKKIDGNWYYFHKEEGWKYSDSLAEIDGDYYSFNSDGTMHTGWFQSGLWYYCDEGSGKAHKGWLTLNNVKYYFDEDYAYMHTGRSTINGKEYCFNSDGSMLTGWYTEINKWADDGSDCIDTLYFDKDGTLHTGWLSVDGKKYWTGSYGYVVKSYPHNGENIALRDIDGSTYGFDENGIMLIGPHKYVNTKNGYDYPYCFDKDGKVIRDTRWYEEDGKKYYVSNGYLLTNTRHKIDDVIYTFDENGVATPETPHYK